ncbi:alpha-L-arabinofuranosidase C-terminal domain-containing protein [Robertkochia solimangrovi]|uniref:alpha-L-arabinofuranosidase C-terminal domain-containing protein n=1 Tax=Robertkochia solimangrovi TaxID=2213046 RepID=UPI00117BF125|nr:alpha-L-arabinofuranosidase C-terminal domain-containing protein [Robertkochia solimangrovi]TRZ43510.1 alpha-L-arabinofuranosidase [Robertkochia solimangrovi]
MLKSIIYRLLILVAFVSCTDSEKEKIVPMSEISIDARSSGWETEYWSNQEHYADSASARSDSRTLSISSDTLAFDKWYKKINATPYSRYRVTGFIRTEGVTGVNEKTGAAISINGVKSEPQVYKGNTDWTPVTIEFETGGEDSFIIECLLGVTGPAKGSVWFEDIKLEQLAQEELAPKISISLKKESEPMSPYIYGQFIEHMGRCIYGGMWAEMLKDRKFYYVPGGSDSPWDINIDTSAVGFDRTHGYSKGDIPVFSLNEDGIELLQDSLAVFTGMKYDGRITLSVDGEISDLKISLMTGDKVAEVEPEINGSGVIKVPFTLKAGETTENAVFKIEAKGSGRLTLAATSLMPADNIKGFRKDVIALMKELNSPIYRWPGGNFVSGYDWKDGLGDPDTRPTKYERAWNGLEFNDVGIHEFMELCKILGAEANVAVNTGLGTAELARTEVEYFNGDVSTPMGKWRAENGRSEPYGVKLWAVGNEMFGDWQLGHMPIEDYVKKHNEVAETMWKADPDIELIGVGYPGHWNDMMYENCAENMTYISEHFYKQDWHAGGLLTHVKQIPDVIREVAEEHRRCREEIPGIADKNIKIAMDEWNYWYGPHVYGLLGTRYFLRDALGIAAGINEFSRQSDIYYMANYAQTVNVIGAIKTTPTGSWLEGTGLVLKLYRNEFGTRPVAVSGDLRPLDIAATITEDGKYLTVSVINATLQEFPVALNIEGENFKESGLRYTITGADDMIFNDEDHPENIYIEETSVTMEGNKLSVPAKSANIYKFELVK